MTRLISSAEPPSALQLAAALHSGLSRETRSELATIYQEALERTGLPDELVAHLRVMLAAARG